MYKLTTVFLCLVASSHNYVLAGLGQSKSLLEEKDDHSPRGQKPKLLDTKYIVAAGTVAVVGGLIARELLSPSEPTAASDRSDPALQRQSYSSSPSDSRKIERQPVSVQADPLTTINTQQMYLPSRSSSRPRYQYDSDYMGFTDNHYMNYALTHIHSRSDDTQFSSSPSPTNPNSDIINQSIKTVAISQTNMLRHSNNNVSLQPIHSMKQPEEESEPAQINKPASSKPFIDLSVFENEISELHSEEVDLNLTYNNKVRQHLRQQIYEHQRRFYQAKTVNKNDSLKNVLIIMAKSNKHTHYRRKLKNFIQQWLQEDYCKRRIKSYYLAQEGFFTVTLRKNVQSINTDKAHTLLGYEFDDPALKAQAFKPRTISFERLEFLGDRVLGLVTAHLLYKNYPTANKGLLAENFKIVVSKQTLALIYNGLEIKPHELASQYYQPLSNGPISEKIASDVIEALMGAIYIDSSFATIQPIGEQLISKNLLAKEEAQNIRTEQNIISNDSLDVLQQDIAYHFNNPSLLVQAFCHSSTGNSAFERFDFLGVHVLNLAIANHIFNVPPEKTVGELSQLHKSILNNNELEKVFKERQLGIYLQLPTVLNNKTSMDSIAPAIETSTLRALLGAVYLDGGWQQAQFVTSRLFSLLSM